jgi:WD40 repeat protein/DNA-binding XRE family transcriptional regulator
MARFSYRERDYAFGQQLLTLRTAIGLTQVGLAQYLGVSRQAVGDWEAGSSYPKAEHLKAFITLAVQHHAFHAGREAAEIQAFWTAAHQKVLLDEIWLGELLSRDKPTGATTGATLPAQSTAQFPDVPRVDWGDAPEVSRFYGRETELALLTDWLLTQRCRVVSLLGMGGIGKTSLAARLAQEVAPHFEHVYWRSLRDALPTAEWLSGAIGFLSNQQVVPPPTDSERFMALLQLLRTRRCLLVLDNFDTLFEPGQREGRYRESVAGYGRLLQIIGETAHQSCLVLTSREAPVELVALGGDVVRTFHLGGLGTDEARLLLAPKQLTGSSQHWAELTARFGGNALALKIVGERIHELFGGDIGVFVEQADNTSVIGSIRRLLAEQIDRSTAPEQQVLRELAVAREPVRLTELLSLLSPQLGREATLEAFEALLRRSLAERTEANGGAALTLQSVVLEYLTDQVVDITVEEITRKSPGLLAELSLIQALAKDFVRRAQERLIGAAILDQLNAQWGEVETEQRLLALLDSWRGRPPAEQGYGPGNVVNLLRLLRPNLRGLDLSCLAIRQAYLAEVDVQDSSLAGGYLSETILAEAFTIPVSLALNSDGTQFAVGTASGQVWLWRSADRTLLAIFDGHTSQVSAVALSPDSHLLAGGDWNGSLQVWDVPTRQLRARLEGHTAGVTAVAFSRDGYLLASGGLDETVRLWEASSGRELAILPGHPGGVWSLALSADGQMLISGGGDGTLRLWDVSTGQLQATLQAHTSAVWAVGLSGKGDLLASGGLDGQLLLWEVSSQRMLATFQGHTGGVWNLALSPDGELMVSSGGDGTLRLWDVNGGRLLAALAGHTGGVRGLGLSMTGHLVASSGLEGTVRLWELPTGQPLTTLQGHTGGIWRVTLSADGKLVASSAGDGIIAIWEAVSGRLLTAIQTHTAEARVVRLSGDGHLLVSGGLDGTVRLWEAPSGRPLALLEGHTSAVWAVALSTDTHLLVSGGLDGTVRLWEAPSGRSLALLEGHTSAVREVALSADGHLVASAGADGTVRLWEAPSGQPLAIFNDHTNPVWAVALSADGQLAASGDIGGTVLLWNTNTGQTLSVLKGHTGSVWGVGLSTDGRLVASASADGTVRLWEAPSGRLLRTLSEHIGPVPTVALSGDGNLLASGGWDGTVRLWYTNNGDQIRVLQPERRYARLDITGLNGITEAQRTAMLALGAVDQQTGPTG